MAEFIPNSAIARLAAVGLESNLLLRLNHPERGRLQLPAWYGSVRSRPHESLKDVRQ